MLRLDTDEKLTQDTIVLNSTLTSPKTIIELPTKSYIDNKFNDTSIMKNTDHADFNNKYLDNVRMITVTDLPEWPNELTSKFYVDRALSELLSYINELHEINRNKRELSSVFNDQHNEFDNNKLTNSDSVTVNRNPRLDNELANQKYIDDELDKNTVLRFNQTLQNYLKVSVGNDT